MIIIAAYGSVYAAETDMKDQILLDRLNEYYKSETNCNWELTYSLRTPLYRKSVPFKVYRKQMVHDNKGWKLLIYSIVKSKIKGEYAAFKIEFIERVPDDYFPNNIEKSIKLNQVSTWEYINGNWFCRNACSRTHLSMNGDLVMRNDQIPIDLIEKK